MIRISLIICIAISAIALLPVSIIFGLLALCYYIGVWCKIINENDYKDDVDIEESTTTTTTSSTPGPSTNTTRKSLNSESTCGPDSTSGYDVY